MPRFRTLMGSAALALGLSGCFLVSEPCAVLSVTVTPQSLSLSVGESLTVTASVSTSNCSALPAVTWASSSSGQAAVLGNGNQAQVTGVLPTATAVTVSATAGGISGGTQATILALPAIALNPGGLAFSATQGGANPASQTATITNSGGGILDGLTIGAITYGPGATGWLSTPSLGGTIANPSVALTVQPITGSLTPGTYTAAIAVVSGLASNTPQVLTVTIVVAPPPPAMAINPASLTFTATQGGANPPSQSTTVTNSGGGTLSGLTVGQITYGPGANGWLQPPTLSNTTANPAVTLTLQPEISGLVPGTYSATVTVSSGVASNSPQSVTATLTVTPPPPAIALAPTTLTFNATQGGGNPTGQFSTITNGGGGVLGGLTVGAIGYGPGATGWLQAPILSGPTATPSASLSIQPITGALPPGTYTATVPVQSASALNSPSNLTVVFQVAAAPSAITLNPATLTFSAFQGGAIPGSQLVTITNGGGGVLSGLTLGAIAYGPGATGWLELPTLSGTTANPSQTLTVRPGNSTLPVGTYSATIPVLSPVASNSPRNVVVTYVVQAALLDPCFFANATPIVVGQTIAGALSSSASCLLATGQYANLYRLNIASTTLVAMNLTAAFDDFLQLFNFNTGALIEEDDDDGPGLNAVIIRSLAPGAYLLRATSFDPGVTGSYTLSVEQVTAGAPATIGVIAGDGQTAAPNSTVAVPPSALVRDANGTPVAGAMVTFATLPGVGVISGAGAVTNSDGIATVGSWTVAQGPNVLSATVTGVSTAAVFSATGSASPAGFNIDLRFVTMPTLAQLQVFASAAARWQTIMTGDLTDIAVVLPPGICSAGSPSLNEIVDDVVIQVTLEPIDGPGAVLGSAGPCFIRSAGSLPLLGRMRFDVADLASMEANGTLNAVILHEMGHVFGIGVLWTQPAFNFLANPSLPSSPGVDTRYTGANGIAGFDLIGGATYTGGGKVPVENLQGGSGSRDSHWRESVLANELMTGFIAPGVSPLSLLTVRSLEDFGYVVNPAAADPFFLLLSLKAEGAAPATGRHLLDDIDRGPLYRLDRSGRITDLNGRSVILRRAKR